MIGSRRNIVASGFLSAGRNAARQAAIWMLGLQPLVQLKARMQARSNTLAILNLHRVAKDDRSAYAPLDPSLFEYLLQFLERNFEIVSFDTLPETQSSSRPKVILSFDDGYRDFIEVAVPILKKYGIRANMNIIPECLETGRPPINVQ